MALFRIAPQIITSQILVGPDLPHKIIIICATKQQAPFTPIYQVLPCNIDDRPDVCSTIHERDAPHVLVVAARRPPTCLSASPDICVRATISGTISFLLACAYVRVSTPRTHVCVPWICLTSPYETLFFGFSSAQILSNKSFQFARWSSKQVLASNCNVPSCNTDDRPDWRYTIHENNVPHVLVFLVRASFCPNRRMHHCVFRHDVRTSVCATTMSRLDTHLQGVATPPVPCLMLQRACKSLTLVPPVFLFAPTHGQRWSYIYSAHYRPHDGSSACQPSWDGRLGPEVCRRRSVRSAACAHRPPFLFSDTHRTIPQSNPFARRNLALSHSDLQWSVHIRLSRFQLCVGHQRRTVPRECVTGKQGHVLPLVP